MNTVLDLYLKEKMEMRNLDLALVLMVRRLGLEVVAGREREERWREGKISG